MLRRRGSRVGKGEKVSIGWGHLKGDDDDDEEYMFVDTGSLK